MKITPSALIAAALLHPMPAAEAAEIVVESPKTRVHLIELFTSEGCSSCPPAEAWLRGLRANAELGRNFIPIAFHVDYWDYLGWKDRFASAQWSARQRAYSTEWKSRQVYTPAFVVDGRIWPGTTLPVASKEDAGVLTLRQNERKVTLRFAGSNAATAWLATIAAPDSSKVTAGENRGHTLAHDFVVTSLQQAELKEKQPQFEATFVLPDAATKPGGLVGWVTTRDSLAPRQAVAWWAR